MLVFQSHSSVFLLFHHNANTFLCIRYTVSINMCMLNMTSSGENKYRIEPVASRCHCHLGLSFLNGLAVHVIPTDRVSILSVE